MVAIVVANVVCSTACMWAGMFGIAWPLVIVITVNLPLGYWAAMRC